MGWGARENHCTTSVGSAVPTKPLFRFSSVCVERSTKVQPARPRSSPKAARRRDVALSEPHDHTPSVATQRAILNWLLLTTAIAATFIPQADREQDRDTATPGVQVLLQIT
jgi:hypothetical protein